MSKAHEVLKGVGYGLWYSQHHIIHSFVIIPFGIIVLFAILYGFNVLLADVFKIQFPASVLGMLINLLVLCALGSLSSLAAQKSGPNPTWKTKIGLLAQWILEHYLTIIKPSMNFSLKWINVFFIPSFIILPLSDHITFIECLKIAAVFVIGGIFLMVFDVYLILGLKFILKKIGVYSFDLDKSESAVSEDEEDDEELELFNLNKPYTSTRDDITTIDMSSLRATKTEPATKTRSLSVSENPFSDQNNADPAIRRISTSAGVVPNPSESASNQTNIFSSEHSPANPSPPPSESIAPASSKDENAHLSHLSPLSQKTTIFVANYIDWFLYLLLFLVSLPFYYVSSIHVMLPYHLGLTVIAYYLALLIPMKFPKLKKFAHPILILTAEILFVCFIGSLIYHKGSPKGFLDDLRFYKTGKNYLNLFSGKALYDNGEKVPQKFLDEHFTSEPLWPGCGDILSSLMDISIVSLSLPMFTHKKDFIKNFWVLMPPLLISMVLTFFCYPIICFKIGISSERSIGFIGRLVTLALGTPLIGALGGSVALMAVCTILSGICGVLIGDAFFNLLRVPSNDFVTRGVTLGINCGAIATAHLLNVDPRAASMSSLSFSVFGTIMIILASIGAVRDLIRSWAGL